jgi:hypothetical protein
MIITELKVDRLPRSCIECNFCMPSTEADKRLGNSDWFCVAGIKHSVGFLDLGDAKILLERHPLCILEEK